MVLAISLVFAAGCGGGSDSSTKPTTKPNQQIPVSNGDSGTGDLKLELQVAGKNCSGLDQKLTSKDLTTAFLNTFCAKLAKGETWRQSDKDLFVSAGSYTKEPTPQGQVHFGSNVKVLPIDKDLVTLTFQVSFQDCSDCPRVFDTQSQFELNPLGEWQIHSSSGFYFDETEVSRKNKTLRDVKVEINSPEFIGPAQKGGEPQITIQGEAYQINLLCQKPDGSTVEVIASADTYGGTFQGYHWNVPFSETPISYRILAYSIEKYSVTTDLIYLDK